MNIKTNCRFFNGSRPCIWHKKNGAECKNCNYFKLRAEDILIIKLAAMGDVLRSTCIIPKIKNVFPSSYITWITKSESIDLLSTNNEIDEVWDCDDLQTLNRLQIQTWDYLYNLDNSHNSSALATVAKCENKIGFVLSGKGHITPTNSAAESWMELAVSDFKKKRNTKSYQEIIYDICGFSGQISKPSLTISQSIIQWAKNLFLSIGFCSDGKYVVGINTGAGTRWPKKMLEAGKIASLIEKLLDVDEKYLIVLLGGPNEEERNKIILNKTQNSRLINMGCNYNVIQFSAIIGQCDVILCGDTLAMHIASALGVPSVVVFGPTSINEIYKYNGLIEPIEANLDCLCCYGDCDKEDNCMNVIHEKKIIDKIRNQLHKRARD